MHKICETPHYVELPPCDEPHTLYTKPFILNRDPNKIFLMGDSTNNAVKKLQYHRTKMCPWFDAKRCFMGDRCNYGESKAGLLRSPFY